MARRLLDRLAAVERQRRRERALNTALLLLGAALAVYYVWEWLGR